MTKIKAKITGKFNLLKNDKSFYEMDLDGLKRSLDCPKCKKKINVSLQYVHPCDIKKNGDAKLNFGCPKCEQALSVPVNVSITIK